MGKKRHRPSGVWKTFARPDAIVEEYGLPTLVGVIRVRLKPKGHDLEILYRPDLPPEGRQALDDFCIDEMYMFDDGSDPLAPWEQLPDSTWQLLCVRQETDWDISELFSTGNTPDQP